MTWEEVVPGDVFVNKMAILLIISVCPGCDVEHLQMGYIGLDGVDFVDVGRTAEIEGWNVKRRSLDGETYDLVTCWSVEVALPS